MIVSLPLSNWFVWLFMWLKFSRWREEWWWTGINIGFHLWGVKQYRVRQTCGTTYLARTIQAHMFAARCWNKIFDSKPLIAQAIKNITKQRTWRGYCKQSFKHWNASCLLSWLGPENVWGASQTRVCREICLQDCPSLFPWGCLWYVLFICRQTHESDVRAYITLW